jgi:hypothetical protein
MHLRLQAPATIQGRCNVYASAPVAASHSPALVPPEPSPQANLHAQIDSQAMAAVRERVAGASRALKEEGLRELRRIFSDCVAFAKKLNLTSDSKTLKCGFPLHLFCCTSFDWFA